MVKIPNMFFDKFLHKDLKNKVANLVRPRKKMLCKKIRGKT